MTIRCTSTCTARLTQQRQRGQAAAEYSYPAARSPLAATAAFTDCRAETRDERSGTGRCWRIWRRRPPPSWKRWPARSFTGEYALVSGDKAPFIWAALSLYWAQMAALIPGKARAEMGDQRQFCPVCASMPVASVVHMGSHEGARYLHCNLCESEWHVVRSKCTQCEQSRDLHYWSIDSERAAVKAESCGDCGTYLKMLYQEKIRPLNRWQMTWHR